MPITVIIADDHRLMRDGLQSLLTSESDIEVIAQATNGRETVKLVRQLQPSIVVMDVSMPDLNGIDATQQIRDLSIPCQILALSMHTDEQYVRGMLQAGAAGYVLKDCAGEELVRAIRTVVSERVYVSPEIAGTMVNDYVAHLSGEVTHSAPTLSAREREVLQLIAEGASMNDIATSLHLSVKTIETHRKRLMDKLEIRTVAGLTKYAIRKGISPLD